MLMLFVLVLSFFLSFVIFFELQQPESHHAASMMSLELSGAATAILAARRDTAIVLCG